ncbi:MAG: glycogen synthase [Acidimicrobiales bacterium]|nr:glycogen synthase [Acidimicrobiales bacterium]
MKVAILSREYPPDVYGGAGVHVEYLSRELAHHAAVQVHCWGLERSGPSHNPAVFAYRSWERLAGSAPYLDALRAVSINLAMAAGVADADVVHSHTWYTNFGGHVAKMIHGIPHVATVHSLEPLRPWKREQLAGGYELSSFCEQTGLEAADAVVAVSSAVRDDILDCYPAIAPDRVTVIHNGIDHVEWHPDPGIDALDRHGVDADRPTVIFVGRITRQKGIRHLLDAVRLLDPDVQVVLRAGSPDTPEIGQEIAGMIEDLQEERGSVVWIEEMLERKEMIQLLTHADVFCCPSIYEPLGLVNLEAMACETPVVATAVGGIPEVVTDGRTGLLVPFEPAGPGMAGPKDPDGLARDLAATLTRVLDDPALGGQLGIDGRRRVVEHFSWSAIAHRVLDLYERVVRGEGLPEFG